MINKQTRDVLKSLIPINNQMIIGPETTGCDEFKSIIFKANLKEIDPDIAEFGIFDTTSFLSALDLLENPAISLVDNTITASDEDASLVFLTSDVSSLEEVQVKASSIDTTVAAPSVLEFEFNTAIISKIKKALTVFKSFDTVYLIKEGDTVDIRLGTNNSFSKSNNSFKMSVEATYIEEKDFTVALPVESIVKIPGMDYKLSVKYNEKREQYRVVLDNALLTLVLSLMK